MLKKIIFVISFMSGCFYATGQTDVNNYKYILVPKTFDFFKTEDQYQLNSLTKFLFNKYGYQAYFYDDDIPEDLKSDPCLALTSTVSKLKGLFKTKLMITLKDCLGASVMASQVGETREKEFKTAYNLALREAFETFQNLDYEYTPKLAEETLVEGSSNVQSIKKVEAVILSGELEESEQASTGSPSYSAYNAEPIDNGFQLVNSESKTVMILRPTAAKDVFIVEGKSAIVFKEDGVWYYSENNGMLGETKTMHIKF